MTRRYGLWVVALGLAGLAGEWQGFLAEAGTISGGTAITLGGLDNMAETFEEYAKGNVGKMLGIVMVLGGIAMGMSGRMGTGLGVAGTGVAAAFVPNIVGTAFDTTTAAPLLSVAPVPVAPVSGVLHGVLSVAAAPLYPLVLVLKYVRDPVVWLSLALLVGLRPLGLALAARLAAGKLCRVG